MFTIYAHGVEPGVEANQQETCFTVKVQAEGGEVVFFFSTPIEAVAFGQAITEASMRQMAEAYGLTDGPVAPEKFEELLERGKNFDVVA